MSRLGEETWLIELEPRLDPAINAAVHRIARAMRASGIPAIRAVVPAMASLAIHFDPDAGSAAALESRLAGFAAVADEMPRQGDLHEVPVCYDPTFGLDIEEVASRCSCSVADVCARHAAVEYRVFMIGFLPGFPYLGMVDARLALPRRPTPRQKVPAGSIGIAGQQTGIYPSESPGGWHIIGRTPLSLFDPDAAPPARLAPEDRVRFVPIRPEQFAELATAGRGR